MGGLTPASGCALSLALLLLALPAEADDRVQRYSGKVERVELREGLVILDELGARGRSRRHELYVSPDTPIVTAARLRPWEMRGTRSYEEVPVSLADLLAGDFVVVETTEADGRILAVRITIVEAPVRPRR